MANGEMVTTAHLHQLVGVNDLTAVRDLLDLSPQEQNDFLNRQDQDQKSALHIAAEHGHVQMTDLLLRQETIEPNLVDSEGLTALDLACSKGEIELVCSLLKDQKVLVNATKETDLREKARRSSPQLFNYLLANDAYRVGPVKKFNLSAAVVLAAQRGHLSIIRSASLFRDKILASNQMIIFEAARHGQVQILKHFDLTDLRRRNDHGISALQFAVSGGHADATEYLLGLDRSAYSLFQQDIHSKSVLDTAMDAPIKRPAHFLVMGDQRVNLDNHLTPAEITAMLNGQLQAIKNPNELFQENTGLLAVAARYRPLLLSGLLVDFITSQKQVEWLKESLINTANGNGHKDYHDKQSSKLLQLYFAINLGHLEFAGKLASELSVAEINTLDSSGNTPLHHAIEMGQWPIAEILITHGADPDIKNEKGQTAVTMGADWMPEHLLNEMKRASMLNGILDGATKQKVNDLSLFAQTCNSGLTKSKDDMAIRKTSQQDKKPLNARRNSI